MLTRIASPGRRKQAGIVALVLILFAGDFAIVSWPSVAQEQEQRARPRSLLDILLFRRRVDEQPPVMKKRQPVKAKAKQRSKSRKSPDQLEPPVVAKLDTARTVIVIGDFMASGLADGLNSCLRTELRHQDHRPQQWVVGLRAHRFSRLACRDQDAARSRKAGRGRHHDRRQRPPANEARRRQGAAAQRRVDQGISGPRRRAGCRDQAAQPALHLGRTACREIDQGFVGPDCLQRHLSQVRRKHRRHLRRYLGWFR